MFWCGFQNQQPTTLVFRYQQRNDPFRNVFMAIFGMMNVPRSGIIWSNVIKPKLCLIHAPPLCSCTRAAAETRCTFKKTVSTDFRGSTGCGFETGMTRLVLSC
jgi:hypothetical protein